MSIVVPIITLGYFGFESTVLTAVLILILNVIITVFSSILGAISTETVENEIEMISLLNEI